MPRLRAVGDLEHLASGVRGEEVVLDRNRIIINNTTSRRLIIFAAVAAAARGLFRPAGMVGDGSGTSLQAILLVPKKVLHIYSATGIISSCS